MTRFVTGVAAASLFLAGTALIAQGEEVPQNPTTQKRSQKTTQSAEPLKMYILGKMLLMNECAIQTGKLAEQRASSPEVKEFARMLVQDHTQWTRKIRAAAPEFDQLIEAKRFQTSSASLPRFDQELLFGEQPAEPTPLARNENPAEETPAQPAPEEQTTRKATFPNNPEWEGQPVYQILHHECEVHQNALKSTLKLLSEQDGEDFDMAFLGLQIAGHTQALAELKAIQNVEDPQLRQLLQDARTGAEKHLKQAKTLAAKYEDEETRDTDSQPVQPQRAPTLPRSQPQPE